MRQLPDELVKAPVEGVNLRGKTFGEQLEDGEERATLLVFLRHLGCVFCRENVKDLRDLAAKDPAYPQVVFVYQGTVEDGKTFFDAFWKEARAIADLPKRFYDAFALERGSVAQLFGPAVWGRGVQALAKGNFIGKPVGDVRVLSGYFLLTGERVIWEYRAAHTGDHPDFASLPEQARNLQAAAPAI